MNMYVEFERTEDANVTNLYYFRLTQEELDLFNKSVEYRLKKYGVKEEIEPITMQEIFYFYEETDIPVDEYFKLTSKLIDERTGYSSHYENGKFTFNLAEWLEEWINQSIWESFEELRHEETLDWNDDVSFVRGE